MSLISSTDTNSVIVLEGIKKYIHTESGDLLLVGEKSISENNEKVE
jgi:hypothetical protein